MEMRRLLTGWLWKVFGSTLVGSSGMSQQVAAGAVLWQGRVPDLLAVASVTKPDPVAA